MVHVPWFYEVSSADVDGHSIAVNAGRIEVPPQAKTIRLRGRMRSNDPALSYDNAVKNYKAEYARKYRKFVLTGEITP